MKKYFIATLLCASPLLVFNSCESCVKNTTKKVTELGISAVEGISEAVNERGEKASEKATDALGTLAKGAGKSLDRQLNEHAEHVASVVGRTFVQSIEGFDKGLTAEYYDEIATSEDIVSGVALDYFGKIKEKAVIDAYFIVLETGKYDCTFEFMDTNSKVLMTKTAEIDKTSTERRYSVVSFALNEKEEKFVEKTTITNISVKKK